MIDTPKTKNSIREIPMNRDLLKMLKPIKKIVNHQFYVLTNDAKPTEPRTYRSYYQKFTQTLNMPDKPAFVESLDLRLCADLLETVENLEKSENHNQNFFTNINKLHRINELHDTNLMPCIHLSSLMTRYDYVIANKKIHASDWADIFHAILYPYCDVVIADASRVDCIRRVQREDGLYKNVRFYDKKAFLKII